MKVVIVPDSFKGSLSSKEVCRAIKEGLLKNNPECEIICMPMADGGEGTAECFLESCGGKMLERQVNNIFFEPIKASFVLLENKTAIVETAAASGIATVPKNDLNPLKASTYGTGELISSAVESGAKTIVVGLGGSATNDGGMGVLSALGVQFLNLFDEELSPSGENMSRVKKIKTTEEFKKYENIRFILACDVENPFYGENGAAYVFAPQKGADKNEIELLDKGQKNLAQKYSEISDVDLQKVKGSGAAGGLCGGLYSMLNCKIESGFSVLAKETGLEEKIKSASLVITGEGRTDFQTSFGKLPKRVCDMAKKYNVPCWLVSGDIVNIDTKIMGFAENFKIKNENITLEYAMNNAYNLLVEKMTEVKLGEIE